MPTTDTTTNDAIRAALAEALARYASPTGRASRKHVASLQRLPLEALQRIAAARGIRAIVAQ